MRRFLLLLAVAMLAALAVSQQGGRPRGPQMDDPQVKAILSKPRVRTALGKLKEDPQSLGAAMEADPALKQDIETLMRKGVLRTGNQDPNAPPPPPPRPPNSCDNVPLCYAAATGNITMLKEWLGRIVAELPSENRSKAIDTRDPSGYTPLHFAAFNGSPEAAAVLIEAGAELDAKAQFDRTPLHVACSTAKVIQGAEGKSKYVPKEDLVSMLLDAGASVSARDAYGANALDLAKEWATKEWILDAMLANEPELLEDVDLELLVMF